MTDIHLIFIQTVKIAQNLWLELETDIPNNIAEGAIDTDIGFIVGFLTVTQSYPVKALLQIKIKAKGSFTNIELERMQEQFPANLSHVNQADGEIKISCKTALPSSVDFLDGPLQSIFADANEIITEINKRNF